MMTRRDRRHLATGLAALLIIVTPACSAVDGRSFENLPGPSTPRVTPATPSATVSARTAPGKTAPGTAQTRTAQTRTAQTRTAQTSTGAPGSSSTQPGDAPSQRAPISAGSPAQQTGDVVPLPADEQAPGGIGAAGIGDDYYPDAGNGGYQVNSYDLNIAYDPDTDALQGTAALSITITASDALRRFDVDLQPSMKVNSVTIDAVRATARAEGSELVITPATALAVDSTVTVTIRYAGKPESIKGGTAGIGDGGWYRTRSGGALAVGEPFGASSWFPVNEHPADPASYRITVTVPQKWKVMGPGVPVTTGLPSPGSGLAVFRWYQRQPIASYLVPLYIDTFAELTRTGGGPVPIYSAVAAGDAGDLALVDRTAPIISVLQEYFGAYPFDSAGGIFTDEKIPFALETASRPVYADWVDEDTVVHELAHQWYGDHVMVQRWQDICLNECFASYAPWLYHQATDGTDLDAQWRQKMAQQHGELWSIPLIDPGAGNEFTSVYTRGPLAVHALRAEIGDTVFFALLKQWPARFAGNATFEQFEAFAEKLSGQDLQHFFQVWFRDTKAPAKSDYPASLR